MATQNLRNTFRSFVGRIARSSNKSNNSISLESCWLLDLPPEILQSIAAYLSLRDLISFSKTCQTLYTLINNDDFWIHLIRCRYSPALCQLYTIDIFQQPENHELGNDPLRPSGLNHIRSDSQIDIAAIYAATHYNDDAVERRHAKMHVAKNNFLNNIRFYQFKSPEQNCDIPLMKLVYFYLLDRKRCPIVNMSVIHLQNYFLVRETDVDSLTGRVMHLKLVKWLEISGCFENMIMPGKYKVSCRMKCGRNGVSMNGETEFIFVPQYGRLLIHRMFGRDFRANTIEHGHSWFIQTMGEIIVYEPSIVLVGIRNWIGNFPKLETFWDCVELTLVT